MMPKEISRRELYAWAATKRMKIIGSQRNSDIAVSELALPAPLWFEPVGFCSRALNFDGPSLAVNE